MTLFQESLMPSGRGFSGKIRECTVPGVSMRKSVLANQLPLNGGIMDYTFCSENITELSKALLNVQRNLHPAIKDATNPFCKNRYATLNSVMDSCRDALLDNGVLLTQYPVPVEGDNLGLVTKLVHAESGQYQGSLAVIPLAKTDPQGMGSAFTYGRRYALSSMLGIICEEDDDGNAASYSKADIRSAANRQSNAKSKTPAQSVIPLSQMLSELGIAELLPQYKEYLRSEYGCAQDKLTRQQYEEQREMLENCKNQPLALRNFMRTLHEYK